MSNSTPPRRPASSGSPGAPGLVCPSCQGAEFSERSSFKTTSEPLLGAEATSVIVDLMTCKRCGADLPAVRGRKRYSLVGSERLAAIVADLEEARRRSAEMEGLIVTMTRRSQSIEVEIERSRAKGEVDVLEQRVASLESETAGLQGRRDQLVRTLELVAAKIPAA